MVDNVAFTRKANDEIGFGEFGFELGAVAFGQAACDNDAFAVAVFFVLGGV